MKPANILCAVETNKEARHIFNVAERVANMNKSQLHLLNVIKPPVNVYADLGFTPLAERTCEWQRQMRGENLAYLHKIAPAIAAEVTVTEGYPAQEVTELAQARSSDLIVMGLHNRNGFTRMLGSTTHSVLNQSKVDLLAVHPESGPAYRRVLFALDTAENASLILEQAHAYLGQSEHIKILTVQEPLSALFVTPYGGAGYDWSLNDLSKQMREEILEKVGDAVVEAGFEKSVFELANGDAREVIVDTAQQWEADLIIMGSHNHGFMERLMLGSTTHGVLNQAPCDVLICRNVATR